MNEEMNNGGSVEKTPFYKKNWFVILLIIFIPPAGLIMMWVNKQFGKTARIVLTIVLAIYSIIWLGALFSPKPTQTAQTTQNQSKSNPAPSPTAASPDIESLSGSPLLDARAKVQDYGYSVTYVYEQSGLDFSDVIDTYTDDELAGWVVTKAKTISDIKKTAQFVVNTPENIASNEAAAAAKAALESKLDPAYAWEAVERYGSSLYPYGFKLHWVIGKLAEEPEDENTWYLKAEATVTNAFNADVKLNCEARVTGTTDNPQIVSFDVY